MNPYDEMVAETVAAIKRAQTTGITTGTGIFGYDLSGLISLVPVETPFRNSVARRQAPVGSQNANWRALLNINNQQPNPAVGLGFAGNEVLFSEQDVLAKYQPLAEAGIVMRDAMTLAQGFENVRATAALQVLNQLMIGEDHLLVGGQAFALAAPVAPTLTNASSGGTLGTSVAVIVYVSAKTGENYFYGGGTAASSASSTITTASSGSTQSVTAYLSAGVAGAVAYDWYVKTGSSSVSYFSTTTHTGNATTPAITVTANINADKTPPTTLPLLASAARAFSVASSTDSSGDSNTFNGLLATITGDYSSSTSTQTTNGTATSSGAVLTDNLGKKLTAASGGITEIDTFLLNIYQTARLSPTALMVNAQTASDIATDMLSNGQAVTYLLPSEADARTDMVAGGRVTRYVNKATGTVVPVETHPSVPPGTIIARTDRLPYPASNVSNVLEVRTQMDYTDIPYAANRVASSATGGPREEFEVRCVETLVNRAPVAMGVLYNVQNG